MDALQDDIQHLNEQLLLIASDPEFGEHSLKLMQATTPVAQRIVTAGSAAIGTAVRCRVPLVTFTPALEQLLLLDPADWRPKSCAKNLPATEVPASLQELTQFVLEFAHALIPEHCTVAQLYFGLSRRAAENLARLGLKHLLILSRRHGVLLRLRAADQLQFWSRILIGERCSGPRAHRISQQIALLSLRAE